MHRIPNEEPPGENRGAPLIPWLVRWNVLDAILGTAGDALLARRERRVERLDCLVARSRELVLVASGSHHLRHVVLAHLLVDDEVRGLRGEIDVRAVDAVLR